ncbi:EamA family transporter [Candidatus Dormiibacter inghamiae]|uniref:DMT family transporter n=1 Tax=Candidatus Dormiibacter inghamiae TaxID=3127013 RepID=UPI0030C6FA2B
MAADRSRSPLLDAGSTILVAVAAAMWATDAYFRPGLTKQLSSGQIVLVEDLLISICLLPVVVMSAASLRRLSGRRWLALAVIAVGPQAIATILFTKAIGYSFRSFPPNFDVLHEVYLLYLLQPIFGLSFARILLGERRKSFFWPLAATALVGVYLIVFADSPAAPWQIRHPELLAGILVLGAVILWAGGTVLGRYTLEDVSFPVTTSLRFILALPVLLVIVLIDKGGTPLSGYAASQFGSFLGIVLVPGLLAMLLYYLALSRTPASLATIAELGYPLALFLIFSLPAPVGQGAPLKPIEVVGAVLLVVAVVTLNFLKSSQVVDAPRAEDGSEAAAEPSPTASR